MILYATYTQRQHFLANCPQWTVLGLDEILMEVLVRIDFELKRNGS